MQTSPATSAIGSCVTAILFPAASCASWLPTREQLKHLVQQRIRAPRNRVRPQIRKRVRHHDEPKLGDAPQLRHFARGTLELVSDDGYGRNAGSLEDHVDKQTARRTCASVADTDNREIRRVLERRDLTVL